MKLAAQKRTWLGDRHRRDRPVVYLLLAIAQGHPRAPLAKTSATPGWPSRSWCSS